MNLIQNKTEITLLCVCVRACECVFACVSPTTPFCSTLTASKKHNQTQLGPLHPFRRQSAGLYVGQGQGVGLEDLVSSSILHPIPIFHSEKGLLQIALGSSLFSILVCCLISPQTHRDGQKDTRTHSHTHTHTHTHTQAK